MVPKSQKKKSESKREEPHHRAAHLKNVREFACPECWTVPPTIRADGISVARHPPGSPKARKFRDTEFCNGQGRVARHVLDKNWKSGHEPEASISAEEFVAHGTKLVEQRQKAREEREAKKSERAAAPKKAKAAPKPKAAKSSPKPKKAKKPKTKADGSTQANGEAVSEETAAAEPEVATEEPVAP